MNLFLQFGHGMMEICRELVETMPDTSVILSPRDLDNGQIERFSAELVKLGGSTLVDPQLYAPRSDHHKLTSHDYWPQQYSTAAAHWPSILKNLWDLNQRAQTNAFILPGLFCERVDSLYLNMHEDFISMAAKYPGPKLATLCLSSETLRFQDQVDQLLSRVEAWEVAGFYVIPEHPEGDYLVDDPLWLSNLMILCAGLKLQKKEVVLGYSNHQMLCMACAGVDALASGTFMNVRSFTLNKFFTPDPEDKKRRKKWYYCPQALSEIDPTFLDVAFQRNMLKALAPLPEYNSAFADVLFSGAVPTTTSYNDSASFKHYLACLRSQCRMASLPSYGERLTYQRTMLLNASKTIIFMHKHGVRGQKRDFEEFIDVNISTLDTFDSDKGFLLNRLPAIYR